MAFTSVSADGSTLNIFGQATEQSQFYFAELYSFSQSFGYERFNWSEVVEGLHDIRHVNASQLLDTGLHLRSYGDANFQLESVVGSAQGDNIHIVQTGDVKIETGAGGDLVRTGFGNDQIDLGEGNDLVILTGGRNYITGGDGNDTVELQSRHVLEYQIVQPISVGGVTELHVRYTEGPGDWMVTKLHDVEWLNVDGEMIYIGDPSDTVGDFDEPTPPDFEEGLLPDGGSLTGPLEKVFDAEFEWTDSVGNWTSDPFTPTVHDLTLGDGDNGSTEPVVNGQGILDDRFQKPEDGGPNWEMPMDELVWA